MSRARRHDRRPAPAPPASAPPTVPRGWQLVAGAILLALVLLAYAPAMRAGFIWNDNSYVTANPTLPAPDGLQRIWFQLGATPQYYPLVFTTFWFEYRLWGLSPAGYHVTNVLLHALAAILVWRLLRRLGVAGAWLAAAIFALHPLHVESVAWITERKNVLSCVMYVASMLAYFRFAPPQEQGPAADGELKPPAVWRSGAYRWSFVLFLLALFSKTVTCSLPAAILVVLWWKRGRVTRRDVWPLVPFFAAGLALASVTSYMERTHVNAHGAEWDFSVAQRAVIAGRALWFYAAKLLWPANLAFSYPRTVPDAGVLSAYLPAVAAAEVMTALVLLRNRIGRAPGAVALLLAGTLLPALGFFNIYPMRYTFVADHYAYIAGIAPIALLAAGAVRLLRLCGSRFLMRAAPVAALLLVLGVVTHRHARVFRDTETLWTDTLTKNPASWLAHNQLGNLAFERGDFDRAIAHHTQVLALRPEDGKAHYNLGSAYLKKGEAQRAIEYFTEAVRRAADDGAAHQALGNAHAMMGNFAQAAASFEAALRLGRDPAAIHARLGIVRAEMGDDEAAVAHFREALSRKQGLSDVRLRLAESLARLGRREEAAAEYRTILDRDPLDEAAKAGLAALGGP